MGQASFAISFPSNSVVLLNSHLIPKEPDADWRFLASGPTARPRKQLSHPIGDKLPEVKRTPLSRLTIGERFSRSLAASRDLICLSRTILQQSTGDAFALITREQVGTIYVASGADNYVNRHLIAEFAAMNHIPAI